MGKFGEIFFLLYAVKIARAQYGDGRKHVRDMICNPSISCSCSMCSLKIDLLETPTHC